MSSSSDIASLLIESRNGNSAALDEIYPQVYQELHRIARGQLRRMWGMGTINTTALVNEVYLKLVDQTQCQWVDRAHFLALSAKAMRQILINYAEQKRAQKRGGDWQRVTFEDALAGPMMSAETLLAVERALQQLGSLDEGLCRLVELRFYGGLTESEIACVLGISERTVRRNWRKTKAVLAHLLAVKNDDKRGEPV